MKRAEIWTVSGGASYPGKPRPAAAAAAVVRSDIFETADSVTLCPLTSDRSVAPSVRVAVLPDDENGLREHSHIMADKITTVLKTKLGKRLGRLSSNDMTRLDRALLVFLGLAE